MMIRLITNTIILQYYNYIISKGFQYLISVKLYTSRNQLNLMRYDSIIQLPETQVPSFDYYSGLKGKGLSTMVWV